MQTGNSRFGYYERKLQTGLTNTEIAQIADSLHAKVHSLTTISNITKKVVATIETFRNRRLKNDCAVIYLDATYVPFQT